MTKQDVIEIIRERLKGNSISKSHIKSLVDTTLESFIDILANEGRIEIRGFGVFTVKKTPERVGRNPVTKEEAIVPARNIVQFKAGKDMRDKVRKEKEE